MNWSVWAPSSTPEHPAPVGWELVPAAESASVESKDGLTDGLSAKMVGMHRSRLLVVLVSTALFAGACGGGAGGAADQVVQPGPTATTTAPETTLRATTTALPADSSIAPSTLPIADVVQLGGDGLGIVTFGAEPEAAIAAATAVFGEPTEDTGWSDPLTVSTCAGTQVRRVSWGSLSLYFGDESPVAQGTPHLFAYSYGTADDLEGAPVGLATPEGIGLGSTVEFLRAAYPEVVVEPGEEGIIEPNFFLSDVLSGRLTGGGDADLVTVIIGGDACGV